MRNCRPNYEEDDQTWSADAYTVRGHGGVAWRVYGWETEPDEDTEWSGCENRTGMVICVMVGDDQRFTFDPEDITPIDEDTYCACCGQIGCSWDGRDRSDSE
jgi:hypothetical protein